MDQINQNALKLGINFSQASLAAICRRGVIIVLQISSIYCMPKLVDICRDYNNINAWRLLVHGVVWFGTYVATSECSRENDGI